MANVSRNYLTDRDIRKLDPKDKEYIKAVGAPKELYVSINPSGLKSFFIRLKDKKRKKLRDFRPGIYSVEEARKDALGILNNLEQGKSLESLDHKNSKYIFGNLANEWLNQKKAITLESYYVKIKSRLDTYILPSLSTKDVKDIKASDLKSLLTPIFNPNNPNKSRLETIHRIIGYLKDIFKTPCRDGYISLDPTQYLSEDFPTAKLFNKKNGIDTRHPALIDDDLIKEFIQDLKNNNTVELNTKRAIYLQILTGNRAGNTAEAKWEDIDMVNGIWTIRPTEMKMRETHHVFLNTYALKILEEQFRYSQNSIYVFPSIQAETGHIASGTINKAIKNMGHKNKYNGLATAHGFRSTFRTICTLNKADLLKYGVTEEAIEASLAHKEKNQIKEHYQRKMAKDDVRVKLMQWYGDHLNKIEDLGIW